MTTKNFGENPGSPDATIPDYESRGWIIQPPVPAVKPRLCGYFGPAVPKPGFETSLLRKNRSKLLTVDLNPPGGMIAQLLLQK
jgi:hypothetical protein